MLELVKFRLFARCLPQQSAVLWKLFPIHPDYAMHYASRILGDDTLPAGPDRERISAYVYAMLADYYNKFRTCRERPSWVRCLEASHAPFWKMMCFLPEPRSANSVVLRALEALHADQTLCRDVQQMALTTAVSRSGNLSRLIISASLRETRKAAWLSIEPAAGFLLAKQLLENLPTSLAHIEDALHALRQPSFRPLLGARRVEIARLFDRSIALLRHTNLHHQACATFLELLPGDYIIVAHGLNALFARARREILLAPHPLTRLLKLRLEEDPMGFALGASVLLQNMATAEERLSIVAGAIYVRSRSAHPSTPLTEVAAALLRAETYPFWTAYSKEVRTELLKRFQHSEPQLDSGYALEL